MMMMMKKRDFS